MKMRDLTGEKIGMLTMISINRRERGKVYWNCVCDCGKTTIRERGTITDKRRNLVNCGCANAKITINTHTTHGMTKTKFYKKYNNMKTRTTNKNCVNYHEYGGRGIKICDRWLDFNNFKDDMHDSYLAHVAEYGEKQTTIERIDVNGDYDPTNCKWATVAEQNGNTRKNQREFLATNIKTGETFIRKSKKDFVVEFGIGKNHISSVLNGKRKSTGGFTFAYI